MENIPVVVSDESNGRQITLNLSYEELQRAQSDCSYLANQCNYFMNMKVRIQFLLMPKTRKVLMKLEQQKSFENNCKKIKDQNSAYKINGNQCQSKIKSLKKTFKEIKDHNNTSGNDKTTWPYFERMQEIFRTQGWVEPPAVASELGPAATDAAAEASSSTNTNKKRKIETILENLNDQRNQRHRQKMEIFNNLLQQKEKHHQEKLAVLRNLCENLNK